MITLLFLSQLAKLIAITLMKDFAMKRLKDWLQRSIGFIIEITVLKRASRRSLIVRSQIHTMTVWTLSTGPNHQSISIRVSSRVIKVQRKKRQKNLTIMIENKNPTLRRNP